MILVALGSNLDGPWGTPREAVERGLQALDEFPIRLAKASTLIDSNPFGRKNQPRYVNAVAQVETALSPESLLRKLHSIERAAGRTRGVRWGPRTLDLDLLDYHSLVRNDPRQQLKSLVLPHPGIAHRTFVLEPITEITAQWIHPISRQTAKQLLRTLRRG